MTTTLYIEFDADGTLRRTSEGAEEWLESSRLQELQEKIEQLSDSDARSRRCEIASRETRIVEMNGGEGSGYLAAVGAAISTDIALEETLTDRQLEVAEFAAEGATTCEIGRALGISPNTVKHHLKNVYERLGIGSRVELARLVES